MQSPDPTFHALVFSENRAYVSDEVSASMNAHTTMLRTARAHRIFDPGVQLQFSHLLDFSFIASLDFVGGEPVDQCTFVA